MRIYTYRYGEENKFGEGSRYEEKKCMLALGFFDGVHTAHRTLIEKGKRVAEERGIPLGIFTFSSDGSLKSGAPRIYADEEKLEIFESLGVDFTALADFSSLSHLSPEEFVEKVLISDLGASACAAGFNFRFGRRASGNSDTLKRLMQKHGREVVIAEELTDSGETVSASRIRTLLSSGNIEEANRLLGVPYSIKGKVAHGNATGRRLGYPTVNLPVKEGGALPKNGVYRSSVTIDEKEYNGLTNLGSCPTFEERKVHAETYLFDFSGDLYGKEVRVSFLEFLRDEQRFSSPEELKMQINIDINSIRKGIK